MKIHILTDLEGCAGIMNERDYLHVDSRYYELARELLTLETSAAVEGALEAGATEVLVVDGHGAGGINRQLLHPRARLLGGRPQAPVSAAFGLDGSFAACMMIGQHSRSNTDGGHLSHTMSFRVDEYRLNNMPIGEIGLWMLGAAYYGVPVVMVSGDQAACDEARSLVPSIETAVVKWGVKRGPATGLTRDENAAFNCMATHLHPDEARATIRERACRAVRRTTEIVPFRMSAPYTLAISYRPEEGQPKGMTLTMKSADFVDLMDPRRLAAAVAAARAKASAANAVGRSRSGAERARRSAPVAKSAAVVPTLKKVSPKVSVRRDARRSPRR